MRPILAICCLAGTVALGASEAPKSPPHSAKGVTSLALLAETVSVEAGGTTGIGLEIILEEGYHTYWRGPGIVGVAPQVEWILPPGCEIGEFLWPAPRKVDMVGIVANGYKDRVLLVAQLKVPADFAAEQVRVGAKVAWMVCAASCHPGNAELTLEIPVGAEIAKDEEREALFAAARASVPPPAPDEWEMTARQLADSVEIVVAGTGLDFLRGAPAPPAIEFYGGDLQVDSDEATMFAWVGSEGDRFRLILPRTDFAGKDAEGIEGLLGYPGGWPGTNREFFAISIPYSATEQDDE